MEQAADLVAMGLVWYVVFLFSTTLHEASHAWTALKLGDPTAYSGGQVTLNPLPHMQREPTGTLLVPILSFVLTGGGWMMGWASAPYDPWWADRHPKRAAVMALAGPVSNFLLVILAGVGIRVGMAFGVLMPPDSAIFTRVVSAVPDAGGAYEGLATMLSILFTLNLLLFIFNLLPLPPLDGSGALPLVLPETVAQRYQEFMRQPGFGLLGIVVAWRVIGELSWPLFEFGLNLLYPEVGYG